MNDTNIEDILDYSVDSEIWLRVLNGKIAFTELICKDSFLAYVEEQNEKYCNDNGLCAECRSSLVEKDEHEEICGSRRVSERLLVCRNGCC